MLERERFQLVITDANAENWEEGFSSMLARVKPDIVVHTPAVEAYLPPEAHLALISRAQTVAAACAQHGVLPVFLSCSRVFGGENKSSYDEGDSVCPADAEGRSWVEAERSFAAIERRFILRVSWVIAPAGNNLLTRNLRLLTDALRGGQQPAGGLGPQRGVPTHAEDVARVLIAVLRQIDMGAENWGEFHYAASDPCSEAEFSRHLARSLVRLGEVSKESVEALIDEADNQDCVSAVITCKRIRDDFGIQARSWRSGMQAVVSQWLKINAPAEPQEASLDELPVGSAVGQRD